LPLLDPGNVIVSAAETPGKLSVRIPVCDVTCACVLAIASPC
jgi:hypothetical protein